MIGDETLRLLAYLCAEVDSSVPLEEWRERPQLRALLEAAEQRVVDATGTDTFFAAGTLSQIGGWPLQGATLAECRREIRDVPLPEERERICRWCGRPLGECEYYEHSRCELVRTEHTTETIRLLRLLSTLPQDLVTRGEQWGANAETVVCYPAGEPLLWWSPRRVSGTVCIYGTRLPAATPQALAEVVELAEIIESWPSATPEVVRRLLGLCAYMLGERE